MPDRRPAVAERIAGLLAEEGEVLMALTDGDKAIVQDIAHHVADIVVSRAEKGWKSTIDLHMALCPGARVGRMTIVLAGLIGAGTLQLALYIVRHFLTRGAS